MITEKILLQKRVAHIAEEIKALFFRKQGLIDGMNRVVSKNNTSL
jgi:hypothetical protein